jgi:hypothetical protein
MSNSGQREHLEFIVVTCSIYSEETSHIITFKTIHDTGGFNRSVQPKY